jgi:hypothetical protein
MVDNLLKFLENVLSPYPVMKRANMTHLVPLQCAQLLASLSESVPAYEHDRALTVASRRF